MMLIITLPLHAGGAYASPEIRDIHGDGFRLSLADPRLSIDSGPLAVGQIDRTGLVHTIAEPHGGVHGIELECMPFASEGRRTGARIRFGPLSAGFSLDGRPLAAASLSYERMSLAVLYAWKGSTDRPLLRQWKDEEMETLYGAASLEAGPFRALGIISFSDHLGIDGFLSLSATWDGCSISVAAGALPPLYDDYSRFLYSVNGTIRRDSFLSEFELRIGETPVFSADYLPYEASIRSRLELHGVVISSSMDYSFSRRGRSRKRDRFTLRYGIVELGYDSLDGPVAIIRACGVEVGFDEGRAYAELERGFVTEHARLRLRLSSDSSIGVAISLDL